MSGERTDPLVLLVGGTGNLGKYFVEAARDLNTNLVLLVRPETAKDQKKIEHLSGFPIREGSLDDYPSLVRACEGVTTVICITSDHDAGPQINLLSAAKEAGVKRFVPSEFSCDLLHPNSHEVLGHAKKTKVREAIQESGLEFLSIQSNGFMGWFGPGCFNMLAKPYPESVEVYDGGDIPLTMTREVDIGRVTLTAAVDPNAGNSHIVIAYPENTLTQNQMVDLWEEVSGSKVTRIPVSADEVRARMKEAYAAGPERFLEAITMHVYQGYILNRLSTGVAGVHDEQKLAHDLYPHLTYTTVRQFYEELVANKDKTPSA